MALPIFLGLSQMVFSDGSSTTPKGFSPWTGTTPSPPGYIQALYVVTSNEADAGMSVFGEIDLVICSWGDCCLIDNLDSNKDDFESGATDVFTGDDLQGCTNFYMAPTDYSIMVAHHGSDAWLGESIEVEAETYEGYPWKIICEIHQWLDDNQQMNLHNCTANPDLSRESYRIF